jgi:acetoin:2,6-dichlorophenolindophenol oxidoreductase subunit alpha
MITQLDKKQLIQAYSTMRRIRDFEERVHLEFATGEIPGFVHLYAGEEASATGVIMHLRKGDYVASTHRGHGEHFKTGAMRPSSEFPTPVRFAFPDTSERRSPGVGY